MQVSTNNEHHNFRDIKVKKLNLKTSVSNTWTSILHAPAGQCARSSSSSDCAVFILKHAGFHLTTDVAAQFPRSQSSRLWDLRSAPATRVPHQDPRRRPLEAASGGRVASLQSGHYRPSSVTVTCSIACLCPWNWLSFWVQTVTECFLTIGFVFWTVSVM